MSHIDRDASLAKMLLELWEKIEGANRLQILQILFLMLFASFAEMLSIGAIFPFLAILVDPDRLTNSYYVQRFLALLSIDPNKNLLLLFTSFFCILTIISAAARVALTKLTATCSSAIGANLSLDMYRRTLYESYLSHTSRNSSEVISQISASGTLVGSVIAPSLNLINSVILFFGILGALILVSPIITLALAGLFGLIYYALMRLVRIRLQSNGERILKESANVTKSLQEGLGGIRDVILDGVQEFYCRIYERADSPLRKAYISNIFLGAAPRFFIEALGMIFIAILAYCLSQFGGTGAVTIPILGALALGAQRLLPVLQQIYISIITIQSSGPTLRVCLNLLKQPLPLNCALKLPELSFKKEIQIQEVNFQYCSGATWALKSVNLIIPKGGRIGIMGPTGGGKSTLLDIFMGLLEPSSGNLVVDDVVINSQNIGSWRYHIAHVPQSIYLTDATIAQNIAFGIDVHLIDFERVKRAANYAQLTKFIDELPEGYDTTVGERGVRLSGGQRQRIGIARALYKQADVLVFDEATSALDGDTEGEVMEAINSLSKELTILLVAHRLTTLKSCDLVVEVAQGTIQKVGSYNDLINS
jgi:ATP-binding cassette, subfamily B, bacterial PglK